MTNRMRSAGPAIQAALEFQNRERILGRAIRPNGAFTGCTSAICGRVEGCPRIGEDVVFGFVLMLRHGAGLQDNHVLPLLLPHPTIPCFLFLACASRCDHKKKTGQPIPVGGVQILVPATVLRAAFQGIPTLALTGASAVRISRNARSQIAFCQFG
jgi:hypothetical protein